MPSDKANGPCGHTALRDWPGPHTTAPRPLCPLLPAGLSPEKRGWAAGGRESGPQPASVLLPHTDLWAQAQGHCGSPEAQGDNYAEVWSHVGSARGQVGLSNAALQGRALPDRQGAPGWAPLCPLGLRCQMWQLWPQALPNCNKVETSLLQLPHFQHPVATWSWWPWPWTAGMWNLHPC